MYHYQYPGLQSCDDLQNKSDETQKIKNTRHSISVRNSVSFKAFVDPRLCKMYRIHGFKNSQSLLVQAYSCSIPPDLQTKKPYKGVVIAAHSIGMHAQQIGLRSFARILAAYGFYYYSFDFQGHGRSEGTRCEMKDYRDFLLDLITFMNQVKSRHADLPYFLFGSSFGATLSILASLEIQKQPHLSEIFLGNILLSPWILPLIELHTPCILNIFHPCCFPICFSQNLEKFSRESYKDDCFIWKYPYPKCTIFALEQISIDVKSYFQDINFPFILLHGSSDHFINIQGSEELFAKSSTSLENKKFVIIENGYHSLLEDPADIRRNTEIEILEWMQERVSQFEEKQKDERKEI